MEQMLTFAEATDQLFEKEQKSDNSNDNVRTKKPSTILEKPSKVVLLKRGSLQERENQRKKNGEGLETLAAMVEEAEKGETNNLLVSKNSTNSSFSSENRNMTSTTEAIPMEPDNGVFPNRIVGIKRGTIGVWCKREEYDSKTGKRRDIANSFRRLPPLNTIDSISKKPLYHFKVCYKKDGSKLYQVWEEVSTKQHLSGTFLELSSYADVDPYYNLGGAWKEINLLMYAPEWYKKKKEWQKECKKPPIDEADEEEEEEEWQNDS
jgi:hypothetical protein